MKKTIITNDGRKGGWLRGKPHYGKDGQPKGGIKAVVTDSGRPVELEGGEVIINKEASKKHWKELSRINQSAGGGVPIGPPDQDTSEYGAGGSIPEFNRNHIPNKWILAYGKMLKKEHPAIWNVSGNVYGNAAFENLVGVQERGYWLDSEKWMYAKWVNYLQNHKKDTGLQAAVAMIKWGGKLDRGWLYMKNLIERQIELDKGKKVEKEHKGTIKKVYQHKIKPSQAPESIAKEHLKEDKKYYSKLETVEQMSVGGTVTLKDGLTVGVGTTGTYEGKQPMKVKIVKISGTMVTWEDENGKRKNKLKDRFAQYFKPDTKTTVVNTGTPKPDKRKTKTLDGDAMFPVGTKAVLRSSMEVVEIVEAKKGESENEYVIKNAKGKTLLGWFPESSLGPMSLLKSKHTPAIAKTHAPVHKQKPEPKQPAFDPSLDYEKIFDTFIDLTSPNFKEKVSEPKLIEDALAKFETVAESAGEDFNVKLKSLKAKDLVAE